MKKILTCLTLMSLFFSAFSMAQTALKPAYKEQSISLKKLSGIQSIQITGQDASRRFYLPIPEQWDVKEIKIQFSLKKSSLLISPSTLSLLVNNTPIESIRLDQGNDQSFLWQVTIPKSLINKKNLEVELVGYLVLSNDVCQDVENKANWLVIDGSSMLRYQYQMKPLSLSFDKINAMFLQKNGISPDQIGLISPQNVDASTLAPLMQISQYFSRQASWRGVKYSFPDSLKDAAAEKGNLILIGRPKDEDFSFLEGHIPLTLSHQQWTDKKGRALPAGQGFLVLMKNPENNAQNLLVISANDTEGLNTAVSQLILRDFKLNLTKSTFLIAEKPFYPEAPSLPENKNLSLKQLEYSDQIIYGDGQKNLNYQFSLPVQYASQPVDLTLYYSHSPFLSNELTSSLALILNGVPINGVELQPKEARTKAVRFTLPGQYLNVGSNSLSLRYYLMLKDAGCSRYDFSQAWGVLYNSSYLSFKKNKQPVQRRLNLYPYFIDEVVTVGLPVESSFYQSEDFVRRLIRFAASLKQSRYLNITTHDQLKPAEQKNIIYLGSAQQKNPYIDFLSMKLKHLAKSIASSNSRAFQSVNIDILTHLLDKKNLQVGFAFLFPASKDSDQSMLIIVGHNVQNMNQALSVLSSNKKRAMLNGDMMMAYADGTFTTLVSEDINKAVVKEITIKKTGDRVLFFLMYGSLGLVVLFLFILLIRRGARNK